MKGNKMKKKILTSVLTMVAMNAQSGPLAVTTSPFSSGTNISSSAMNGKFHAIETYVNGSVCRSDGTNCLSNGTVTQVIAGTGLVPGTITGAGTLAVNVGTSANQIVQLNTTGGLPGLNGSLLTNLNAGNISTGVLPLTNGGTGVTSIAALRTSLNIPWSVSGSSAFFNTGNVGIGTDIPGAPLTIKHGSGNIAILIHNSNNPGAGVGSGIEFMNTPSGGNRIARILGLPSASGGDLVFQTSSSGTSFPSDQMIIKSNGKVGIGTPSPSQLLSVLAIDPTGPTSGAFTHYSNGSAGYNAGDGFLVGYKDNNAMINNLESTKISFGIAGTEQMAIHPIGDVIATRDLVALRNVDAVGVVFAAGSALTSDVRLKKDFAPIKDVFEKLSTLEGYYFNWKDKSRPEREMGLKAQEVEKSFPEIVKTKKDGFKSVGYQQLVAPLIDAVNLLHKRVSVIEAPAVRTPASESRLQKLETENAQLKAWICAKDASAPFCRSTK